MGIVAPMVMDADEARLIVAATKYPPYGNRSIGGGMHSLNYGTSAEEYYKKANDEILVIIQTEHIEAVEIADEIYAVPGLDAVFVGPNDLTYSMRAADGSFASKEDFEATLTRIREAAKRQKLPCGLHVFSAADAIKTCQRGLAVHRGQQRAQDDDRRSRRDHPPGRSRTGDRQTRQVLKGGSPAPRRPPIEETWRRTRCPRAPGPPKDGSSAASIYPPRCSAWRLTNRTFEKRRNSLQDITSRLGA